MLQIKDLVYFIDGRKLFDAATVSLPAGQKVGLVGRNGSGKSTLLALIAGELQPDGGSISVPRRTRIGQVAQEAPDGPRSLIDTVLAADKERQDLLTRSETATTPDDIAAVQLRLADIDAHSAPARAAAILSGLGFSNDQQLQGCAEFSGGWRMRVALAAALFARPDLLLLDEPSNYLDLEGVLWLTSHLRSYPHSAVIVSHDTELLNQSVQAIVHLARGKLSYYRGSYDRFDQARRTQQALDLRAKKKQDDQRRRLEGFVDRFRAQASKAAQAQSRLKALARLKPVTGLADDRIAPFLFASPAKPLAPPLIMLEQVVTGYDPNHPVLSDVTLRLDPDDRIGLIGANGNGKSTFAKLLSGRLQAFSGDLRPAHKMTHGLFAQHQMDELQPERTPYDHIQALMPDATRAQIRTRLGSLGFGVELADTKAGVLSGGEKARLLFALASFSGPDLLILDEPTNHLDTQAREALIQALCEYRGAVILITHDSHLLDACADRLWLVAGGTVEPFDGTLADYRQSLLEARRNDARLQRQDRKSSQTDSTSDQRQARRRAGATKRARLAPLKKRIVAMETEIAALGTALDRLDDTLAAPGLFSKNPEKARALAKQRGSLKKQGHELEEQWLELSEQYEALKRDQAIG
jgi:ATP-binding cassette subfamily F protein 3